MQKVRVGEYVGVRYNIQSSSDDFEIYNVVSDPQEGNDLAGREAYTNMQLQMKAMTLQSRMPDTSAARPYDNALVPSIARVVATPGIVWKRYDGNYPWVSRVDGLKETAKGIVTSIGAKEINATAGILYQEGYLKVPADGTYTFVAKGYDGFVLRIHNALVVDGSYHGQTGFEASGSIRLQAGYHPFKL